MNNINHNYESSVANKDVKEGPVTFTYIESKDNVEIFAVPGWVKGKGATIAGREHAIHAARCLIRSHSKLRVKPKVTIESLAEKTVSRLIGASPETAVMSA